MRRAEKSDSDNERTRHPNAASEGARGGLSSASRAPLDLLNSKLATVRFDGNCERLARDPVRVFE